MSSATADPAHFSRTVSQLVATRPPVATQAIYSSQGIKLIEKGSVVNSGLYERLTQHRLAAPLEDSLQAQGAVTGKSLRATAEELVVQLPILACMIDKPALQSMLFQAIEYMPLPAPIAFQLTVARDVHPGLYRYLVCTAMVAGWLASGLQGASRHEVSMLVAAGLLHDLGMMHVDPVLLTPDAQLAREQRRQLYSHPLVSELLLERHHVYPPELVRAVREHHEMLDGSGYPAGLKGSRISPWGQILSLSQVVSSLLRPVRRLRTLRLSMLLRTNRHHFNPRLGARVLEVLQRMTSHDSPSPATAMGVLETLTDPVDRLVQIDRVLTAWPSDFARDPAVTQARREGMAIVGEQCAHMRRILAETGATVEQLAMLSDSPPDESLDTELSLITRELAWQLRTVMRQARRRWSAAPGEDFPEAMQAWLEQAEGACHDLIDD